MSQIKSHAISKIDAIENGKGIAVAIEGMEYAVFKVNDNEFYATSAICPHQGGRLDQGCVEDYKVTCPWHAWGFDVRTGACDTVPEDRIRVFKCHVKDEQIYIEIPE